MAMSSAAQGEPMMNINTTPLIDVMLVLLIMFIITIPLQTHSVKVDVPPPGRSSHVLDTNNEITIDDRNIVRWNGARVDSVVLRQYLDQSQSMEPRPELHIRAAAGARYEAVDEVLVAAKRAHVTNLGFVGNNAFGQF